MVLPNFSTSVLIFCLVALLIVEIDVLKPPLINADLSLSPFNSISFCFTYFAALLFGVNAFRIMSLNGLKLLSL